MDLQLMNVKVVYTLNDKDQSPCLHRLPQAQPVNVAIMHDGSRLGAVDLKTCVEEVLKVSPELLPKLKEHDHAVYAYDYSEEDVPTVGQGKLSAILNQDTLEEEAKQIVGRVMKNPMAVFKKQAAETLEVRLKFVALPSDSPLRKRAPRPQLLDTSGSNTFANRLQAAYNRPAASSPQYPMSSSPGYAPADFQLFPPNNAHNSPASISQQELDLFLNSPVPSPTMSKAAVAIDLPQQLESRPPSRHSTHAPTPPATSSIGVGPPDVDQGEEGPARKRARLEQAPRPRSASAFGTQPRDAPLRRTASTTASIRHFRPHLAGATPGAFGQETDGSNRAPTPRPQRLRNAMPRRTNSMSTLRQAESFDTSAASSPPTTSPDNPSPAFTSSPPLRDFEVYDEGQQEDSVFCSSPLPPYNTFDDSTFNLDEFDVTFSELPAMPSSDFDARVEIRLGSGSIQDSGIGMMSEDQLPTAPPKVPTPPAHRTASARQHQFRLLQQIDDGEGPQHPQSRRGSVNLPNQKTQSEFAPGEHPLYQQRTTNIAWNSYRPQGGAPLYVQVNPNGTMNKAASSAAWRNKPPRPVKSTSSTPVPISSTPAPSSPMPHDTLLGPEQHHMPQTQLQGEPAYSLVDDGHSPPSTNPQTHGAVHLPRIGAMSVPMTAPTPPPPEATSAPANSKKSPTDRGRKALGEVSGNTEKVAIPRASTPKPNGPTPTSQAWTPGSKTGAAKRKRTASKAPSKTTKDKETPSGRGEKRAKHAPKPLLNEKEERLFCITCGAIESSAWRNLYSKCFPGPDTPATLFGRDEKFDIHPNVDAAGKTVLDEQGHPRWYTVHKKDLTREERESDTWHTQKQCNPCGVYFNQNGRLKVPDWRLLAAKDGVTPSDGAIDPPLLDGQQQQCNGLVNHPDGAPIDLTLPDANDDRPGSNDSAASAGSFQLDHLFNKPSVQDTDEVMDLSQNASNGSSHSTEQRQLNKSNGNASRKSHLIEADKENLPPQPQASHSPDPAHAFNDLPVTADDTMQDGAGNGDLTFEDLWTRDLEDLDWPVGPEERRRMEMQAEVEGGAA